MKVRACIFAIFVLTASVLPACETQISAPQLVWTLPLGHALQRAPILSGDLVLAAPKDDALFAVNARSGKIVWTFSPGALWEQSLAADGEHAWIAGRDGNLYALDTKTGAQLWQRSFGADIPFPILVTKDALYLTTTNLNASLEQVKQGGATLWALNPENGETLWQFTTSDYAFQSPFKQDARIYVGGSFYSPQKIEEGGWMRVYALNDADGEIVWKTEGTDGFIKSIYATNDAVNYVAYRDNVVGLDARTGQELWRRDTGNWTPALTGQENVLYTSSANTRVYAWRASDGTMIWEHNLGGGSFNYVMGAPVPVQNSIVLVTQRGDLVGLDRRSGELQWSHATGKTTQAGLTANSDGYLYFGSEDGTLYAYRFPVTR